jgi:cysteinyl-tRNA synthetase
MSQAESAATPLPLQLTNTLTGQKEAFQPLEPGRAKLYVCGPTVYDAAHLGHARCYITWDVLVRFLKFAGYDVTYVRNVTDVDDKIINRARDRGQTPKDVAETNYESFRRDMTDLNTLPPSQEPRATEHIPGMVAAIEDLIAKGAAYVTPSGTVYYRVAYKADYGHLSKKPLDDLQSGSRVEVDPEKESPLDFALWKPFPAEPGYTWPSPWGHGRPGWHIECSAMNRAILGDQIDIHAGGADLIFPHHENEIAQTEAWINPPEACSGEHKKPFARYWLHNGFVNVSGEKMSKSLGNFSTIRSLLGRYDANTIRYFLLTNHYRMPVDFNDEALQAAENRTQKIRRAFEEAHRRLGQPVEMLSADHPALAEFLQAMQDDMNTARALAALDAAVKEMNRRVADNADHLAEATAASLTIYSQLGFNPALGAATDTDHLDEELHQLLTERNAARKAKDWATADRLRDELKARGYAIVDQKDGTSRLEPLGR